MKDYLNQEELNDFMIIGSMMDASSRILGVDRDPTIKISYEKIRQGWAERNNLTKDEHKNLKMAETYLAKWYQGVISRLHKDEIYKIGKRLEKFKYRIMDDFTLRKVYGEINNEMKIVKMDRNLYYNWCVEIMDTKCKDCTKHHSTCELCNVFEETLIPESSWGLENCRYAYKKKEK